MFQAAIKSRVGEDISILVSRDNSSWNYLCDCGEASGLTVKECLNIKAVFISHTHIDHFANFDQILRHRMGMQNGLVICGPKHIARQIQSRIRSYTWNLINGDAASFQVREILDEKLTSVFSLEPPLWELQKVGELSSNVVFEAENFVVDCVILDHKIPSVAYRFKENDTINIELEDSGFPSGKWVKELKDAYKNNDEKVVITIGDQSLVSGDLFHLLFEKTGDSLGIIMDHAANEHNHEKIRSLFTNCRQVFIEAFYKAEDSEFARLNYHSYSTRSGEIMKACAVEEAIPVHFSRRYEAADIAQLKQEFALACRR